MTATVTQRDVGIDAERDSFGQLLHAEWTKFRTVRGWVIGMIVGGLLIIAVNFIPGGTCGGIQSNGREGLGGPGCALTLGPTGQAVTDNFYFVHQPMTGNGSITVRVTSMTGSSSPGGAPLRQALQPWSKAGIIIKAGTRAGSVYAAMMVTGGHGVRMQWNYIYDTPGAAGAASAAQPRWLRLTRAGDTVIGYDSTDGAHWTKVGTATLPGLPATVQAGLFAASPGSNSLTSQSVGGSSASGESTQATAAFDHVTLRGTAGGQWRGTYVGVGVGGLNAPGQPPGGGYRQSRDTLIVSGSGDIAPNLPGGAGGSNGSVAGTLVGTFAGLIAVLVVGTIFIAAEFRRGLIRVTLTASPRRTRVLAAKAVALAAVTFAVGLAAAYIALLTGERKIHAGGSSVYPVPTFTEVRMIVGTAALLAVAAVLALGIGAALRRGAAAVTAVITLIVLPYFFAGPLALLPAGAAEWLLRVTPAAGFAIQQGYPRYSQLDFSYTPGNGYFPLGPWAGFAVLCLWAAIALGVAGYLLNRRDA